MQKLEFYQRAFKDVSFRREKLDDLRYLKTVGTGLIWFCGAGGAAASLYTGFAEGRWESGVSLMFTAALCASVRSVHVNQIAALEAFEQTPDQRG
jgi:hypothetical protein